MSVIALSRQSLDHAAVALARAFHDDPLQNYVFPDAEERRIRSPAHFRPLLEYGLRFGEVLTTAGTPLGAAVWLPPNQTDVTDERAAAAGLDRLPETLGTAAAERFFSALGYLAPFHDQDVPEPHWYTMVVGVVPEAQGQGVGRALLQPILDRASSGGHPCYLETAQPGNVGFYEQLGFRVLRDVVDPANGLRMWTFRRD